MRPHEAGHLYAQLPVDATDSMDMGWAGAGQQA
jgi:hypothetical protein